MSIFHFPFFIQAQKWKMEVRFSFSTYAQKWKTRFHFQLFILYFKCKMQNEKLRHGRVCTVSLIFSCRLIGKWTVENDRLFPIFHFQLKVGNEKWMSIFHFPFSIHVKKSRNAISFSIIHFVLQLKNEKWKMKNETVVLTIFHYHYLAVTSIILAYLLYLGNLDNVTFNWRHWLDAGIVL